MEKECFTQVSLNNGKARRSTLAGGGYVLESKDGMTMIYLDDISTYNLLSVFIDNLDKRAVNKIYKNIRKAYVNNGGE